MSLAPSLTSWAITELTRLTTGACCIMSIRDPTWISSAATAAVTDSGSDLTCISSRLPMTSPRLLCIP